MEKWKDIKGYEGLYQISNIGRVKRNEKIIHQSHNNYGYLHISLCKEGKVKTVVVHKLVAEAFIDNPNNYRQINHIDGNKQNNSVENLEWCNQKYNNIHALKKGLRKSKNIAMIQNNKIVKVLSNRMDIPIYLKRKVCQDLITRVCNGQRKTAYGCRWKYEEI